MLEMNLKIQQDDIDKGEPLNPHACPIALALRRQFPKWNTEVSGRFARLWQDELPPHEALLTFSISILGQIFIRNFDQEHRTKPTTITLTLVKGQP